MKVPRLTLVMGPQDCGKKDMNVVLEASLAAGLPSFQYRVKNQSLRQKLAPSILELMKPHDAQLAVNDDPYLAQEMGASILHLGQDDMELKQARTIIGPDMMLGLSVRHEEEAKNVAPIADYAGVGPVFGTLSKMDAAPALGPERARAIADMLHVPVIFIGGINHGNIGQLDIRDNEGVAVISAIASAEDPAQATQDLLSKLAIKGDMQ